MFGSVGARADQEFDKGWHCVFRFACRWFLLCGIRLEVDMLYVSDLMTTKVFSLVRTHTLRDVRELMDMAKIRHIPILDEADVFHGLVTHRDLLGFTVSRLAELESSMQDELDSAIMVAEIMRTDVTTTTPETLLCDAAEQLYRHKYGCLPVLEQGRLVGIITEADFLRLAIALLQTR